MQTKKRKEISNTGNHKVISKEIDHQCTFKSYTANVFLTLNSAKGLMSIKDIDL